MGLPILFTLPQNSFNWLDLRKDFDKFVNQLDYEFKKQHTQRQEQGSSANNDPQSWQHKISNKDENNNLPPPPVKTNKFAQLHCLNETDNKSLEMFIKKIEKDLFNPENVKKVCHNLSEKAVLKDIRYWDKNVVRVQDKGSRFVVLDNEDYIKKVESQINRSSFQQLE